jgi:hypothetical protein
VADFLKKGDIARD